VSTIIASERPALHLGFGTVHRESVADLADMLMWVGVDWKLGTVVFTAAWLPADVQDGLYELGLALVDGALPPSMAWVKDSGKYQGTIRKRNDAGLFTADLCGTVDLARIGGAR